MDTLHWTTDFLLRKGLDPQVVQWIALAVDLLLLLLISWVADFIARRIILSVIHAAVKRTKATWDDYFYNQKVFRNIAHLVPAGIVYGSVPIVFDDLPYVVPRTRTRHHDQGKHRAD